MSYNIEIWQSLLIAIWVGLVMTRSLGTMTLNLRSSPLVTSLVVGIILGEVSQSVMIGAAIQLVYMGVVGPGGVNASEPTVAAAVAIPTAIYGGISAEAASAIAVPVGLAGTYLSHARFFINTILMNRVDKAAEKMNDSMMTRYTLLFPFIGGMLLFVPTVFIAIQYGAPFIADLLQSATSKTLLHVLEVVGGGLAAVGIAAAVYIIAKPKYMPFFIIAYFLAVMLQSLEVNMTIYALLGALVAVVYVTIRKEAADMANS